MANEARPIRSLVGAMSSSEDEVRESITTPGADAYFLDLEDTVHPDERPTLRTMHRRVLDDLGTSGYTIMCRGNVIGTGETGNDLEAIVCAGLHPIWRPKPQGPEDVIAVSALLDHFEQKAGLEVPHTWIFPLMETTAAIMGCYQLAKASHRVEYMGAPVTPSAHAANRRIVRTAMTGSAQVRRIPKW